KICCVFACFSAQVAHATAGLLASVEPTANSWSVPAAFLSRLSASPSGTNAPPAAAALVGAAVGAAVGAVVGAVVGAAVGAAVAAGGGCVAAAVGGGVVGAGEAGAPLQATSTMNRLTTTKILRFILSSSVGPGREGS